MKTLSAAMQTHLEGEVITLATCWKVVRSDGETFGYTGHDVDITYDGVTYVAGTGISPSAIKTSGSAAVDNLDITGLLNASGVTDADIIAKKYDNAEIYIFLVNYNDLTMGDIKLARGRIGEIEVQDNVFTAEFRSLGQYLQHKVGERFSAKCRADLGDTQCGVTLASYTDSAAVTSVTDRANFGASALIEADGYYNYGKLTWTGGNNNGYVMEVKVYTTGVIELLQKMPYEIQVGDAFDVSAGCDKSASTCANTYSNIVNFRGEPFLPGADEVMRFGGQ